MRKEDKNGELMCFLKEQNTVFVFDVDGVLAPFEYRIYCNNICLDSE